MGEYGGENVKTSYEDVGESEITENEPSLSTDDNAPRLDQDVATPPSQKDRSNVQQPRIKKGEWNHDPTQGEGCTTAFSRPKIRARKGPLMTDNINYSCPTHLSTRDATPRNYGRMPLIIDIYADNNVRPLPSVNEDAYGGGVRMISRSTTNHNYGNGKEPPIRGRLLSSVANEDTYKRGRDASLQ